MTKFSVLQRNLSTMIVGAAVVVFASTAIPSYSFADSKRGASGSHASDKHGGSGGKGLQRGQSGDTVRGSGGRSLRDIFRDVDDEEDHGTGATDSHDDHSSGQNSTAGTRGSGNRPTTGGHDDDTGGHDDDVESAEEEDSDRPEWAGVPGRDGKPGSPSQTSGTKKGDLFGDMYVLLRDENGVPIYTQLPDGTWVVQPVDADGNPIDLDEDGHPVDEDAALEVELGRLNVGRAPTSVLIRRYDEVLNVINSATAVSLDASGRLVLTVDGEEKTIDSPLENLAIYVELVNTGTLTDVTNPEIFTGDLANLVDGMVTPEDLIEAKSFLAAASDKFGSVGIDTVEYVNSVMGLEGTLVDQSNLEYVDYSGFTYDRESTYASITAEVLVLENGVWVPTTVNVYEAVFASTDYDGTNVEGFAQATDDARAVIAFIHEYEVPTE